MTGHDRVADHRARRARNYLIRCLGTTAQITTISPIIETTLYITKSSLATPPPNLFICLTKGTGALTQAASSRCSSPQRLRP